MNITISPTAVHMPDTPVTGPVLDPKPKQLPIDWQGRDPVAVAACAWRLHTTGLCPIKYGADLHEINQVTPEDQALAQQIRSYYQQQILMQVLAGRNTLTEFRSKLYGFLTGSYQLMSEDIGLLYKLPYFYHHDQDLASVAEQSVSVAGSAVRYDRPMTLAPLLITESHEIRTRGMQYWWLNEHKEAVRIAASNIPMLTALMGGLWHRGARLSFCGDFRTLQKPLTMGNHVFWDMISAQILP